MQKIYLYPFMAVLFFVILLPLNNAQARSNPFEDNQIQKLVLLEGTESRLMEGDPLYRTETKKKSRYRFNSNQALPFLLSTGWEIKSIHLNQSGHGDYLYGYAIVEKVR